MALKTLKKRGEKPEVVTEEVEEVSPETVDETSEEQESPYLNSDEAEALSEQVAAEEAEKKKVSIKKMESVVDLVQREFHLEEGNYSVNSFSDKGTKSVISLSNEDFDISITIKDNEKFNIV